MARDFSGLLSRLETFISENGGRVTYDAFKAEAGADFNNAVAITARQRFNFRLRRDENGVMTHYVELKES